MYYERTIEKTVQNISDTFPVLYLRHVSCPKYGKAT